MPLIPSEDCLPGRPHPRPPTTTTAAQNSQPSPPPPPLSFIRPEARMWGFSAENEDDGRPGFQFQGNVDVFLVPDLEPARDGIVLSGIRQQWTHTDQDNEKETFWPGEMLYNMFPNARRTGFEYSLSTERLDVRLAAMGLLKEIAGMRKTSEETVRPIVFIGHGLGGVVVKQALNIAASDRIYLPIALKTHSVIFFATPHSYEPCLVPGYRERFRSLEVMPSDQLNAQDWDRIAMKMLQDSEFNLWRCQPVGGQSFPEVVKEICEDFRHLAPRYNVLSFYAEDEPEIGTVTHVPIPQPPTTTTAAAATTTSAIPAGPDDTSLAGR
ncbi:hypothetical protein EX30DRAFT_134938 [Ascodesmis nigricans]|uniref:DUF676 domain-containing protein n=1 Tax=Ascodesmis nigricans TaxID=341454 RepID=A0A4S2MN55_9PEZI|nr:hypothetical protein EX30DRAFT_134938 [Ascodesmis nigricans]